MELELRSVEHQGAHEIGGAPRGRGRAPHPRGQGVGPLAFIFCQYFLYFPKLISVDFQVIPRTFVFCIINNIMAVLLKTASVRVSFIQIMQVRVQNKGKSVWKSRYVGDVSRSRSPGRLQPSLVCQVAMPWSRPGGERPEVQ